MYAFYKDNSNHAHDNGRNSYYNDQAANQVLCTQQNPGYNMAPSQGLMPLHTARGHCNMKQHLVHQFDNMQLWSSTRDFRLNGNTGHEDTYNQALDSNIQPTTDNTGETSHNDTVTDNNTSNPESVVAKEVSPLYLITELAKYNKISHQYILTDEVGPAHKKVFSVKLKLGDEEFSSTGASIKKAQHAAATEALTHTSYAKPVKKNPSNKNPLNKNLSLTPTVQLNALAMKQGKSVVYRVISNNSCNKFHNQNFYQGNRSFSHFKNYEPIFNYTGRVVMEVEVDGKVYSGVGTWMKQAKNACATAALIDLKKAMESADVCGGAGRIQAGNEGDEEKLESKKLVPKSEISQIYEIAFKRQMTVNFTVSKESGPAHMKVYQTTCTCGEVSVEGVGNSKKDSKKDSAAKMLVALNQLPPLPSTSANNGGDKKPHKKPFKKIATKAKLQKANPDLREGFHPISRLYQIQQAKKQSEPVYKTIKEEGRNRNKKFLVEVCVGDKSCTAWSSKIKTARLLATENMLQLLGYVKPPGNAFAGNDEAAVNNGAEEKLTLIDKNIEALANESNSACPIEQLQYIALKLGFSVHLRDFPKNSDDGTYVTLVSLTTVPTLHCHGEGVTMEESQKAAAKNTIQQLLEFVAHMKVSLLPATTAAAANTSASSANATTKAASTTVSVHNAASSQYDSVAGGEVKHEFV